MAYSRSSRAVLQSTGYQVGSLVMADDVSFFLAVGSAGSRGKRNGNH